jgi:hypothetical protein
MPPTSKKGGEKRIAKNHTGGRKGTGKPMMASLRVSHYGTPFANECRALL